MKDARMRKTILLTLLTMGAWVSIVGWIYAQRPPTPLPRVDVSQSQETIDTIQNLKLNQLTDIVSKHSDQLLQLEADRNWLMGGLATVGGIFIIVQIMQIVTIRKKDD